VLFTAKGNSFMVSIVFHILTMLLLHNVRGSLSTEIQERLQDALCRQCTYNVTMRRDLETIVAVKKQQVLHILSVCMCVCGWVCVGGCADALACACARVVLPSAQRACAILSSVASLAPPNLSTLSHKRHDFRKRKVTKHKIRVFYFL
jgi:hypothetical protein